MRAWLLNNLGLKLLSLCLAALLWAVVLGEQKVEVSVSVPLTLTLPADLVLVNDPAEALEVHLRGPRTLVSNVPPREVSLVKIPTPTEEGENTILLRPDMFRVPRGIRVVDVTPRRVRVVLEPLVEQEVEVTPRLEGEPGQGFVVRRVTCDPPRVRVAGPKGEVWRLTRVRTVPVPLDGHTASFSTRVGLEPPGGQVRFQGNGSVTVQVEIGPKKS